MRLVIFGAGGHGKTVADVASQLGYDEIINLDDVLEDKPLSSFVNYIREDTWFISAFGNNALRMKCISDVRNSGGKVATLVHPSSYVSPTASVGEGTVVLPKAIINTGVVVKEGCIINLGSIVDHGTIIEDGVHLCCGAIVKAENRIAAYTKVEAGEVIEARTFPL